MDGADDADAFFGPKQLYQILPQTTYGSIVFTSRNENLMLREYFVPSKEHIIHLCRLERGDAVRLIQTRLGKSSNEMEHTLELIDLLEGLPLALSQAASFVSTSCGSIKEYLCLYRESEATRIELLREGRSHKDGSFSNPVATTWQISFDRIKRDNDFAAHLLSVGACLHCQQIPKSLLPRPDNSVRDKAAWSILKGYSMVTTSSDGAIFNMHPLVHLTIRHWLESNGQLEMYTQIAFDSVYGRFPEWFDQKNDLVVGDQYSIHAQTVIQNVKDKLDDRYVQLVSRASRYLRAKGDYKGALSYAQKAADLSRSGRGQRDLHTLTTLNDLVVVNWYLGNYLEAEKLGREVADLREQLLGTQHKDTLASLNNLGLVLNSRGKYEAAESLHRQVLKAREDLLGPTHNDTLKSLNNLGLSLKMQEKYEEAEEVFHRVFMERRGTLGTDQISTLRSMNNLGLVLQFRGKHEEAFIMHSGALQAKEIILGPEHPDTLRSKQNIAVVFKDQGRLEESEAMAREVLNEFMRLLGEHHPDTLCARSNLAIVLREQGKNRDAERMWQEVLDVQKTKLGPDHPQTIFSRTRLNEVADYIRKHPELDEAKTFTPPGLD